MSIRMVGPIVTPDVRRFSIQRGRLINEWGVDCGSSDDLANMKGKVEIIRFDNALDPSDATKRIAS